MLGILCSAALSVLTPPVGVLIDCSTWTGAKTTRIEMRFEAWDGTVLKDVFECPAGTDPSSPRGCFWIILKGNEWRFVYLENYKILVHGSKDWPVRRVSFKSTGWIPNFQYVPGRFTSIAPPPREVKP